MHDCDFFCIAGIVLKRNLFKEDKLQQVAQVKPYCPATKISQA
jgi:hypothetical protein